MPSKNEDNPKKGGNSEQEVDAVLNYNVVVKAGPNDLVRLQGNVPMPMFLDPISVNQSEVNFKKIFDALVVDPVKLQVQTKIRERQDAIKALEAEQEISRVEQEASDVFMLNNTESEEIKDDQQPESSSDNPSEGREQGNPEQEHTDGEWDTPDPVSG